VNSHGSFVETDPFAGARIAWRRQDFHEEMAAIHRAVVPASPRLGRTGGRAYVKKPSTLTSKVLGSGDVLLSHGLSPYYHRGCSVSLPCSEWERVGPLRYDHQKFGPSRRDKFLMAAHRAASLVAAVHRTARTIGSIALPESLSKNSQLSNINWFSDIYIQVFGILPPVTAAATTSSEFF
jgi:hypothetical protein